MTGGDEVDMMELAREKMVGRERMESSLDSNLLGWGGEVGEVRGEVWAVWVREVEEDPEPLREMGEEPELVLEVAREVGELDLDREDEVEVSTLWGERKTCSSGIRDSDINESFHRQLF
jgi:hypothetical protein